MNQETTPSQKPDQIQAELLDQENQVLASGKAVFRDDHVGIFYTHPQNNRDKVALYAKQLRVSGQNHKLAEIQFHNAVEYDHYHFELAKS